MKTIDITNFNSSKQAFKRYLSQYVKAHGFRTPPEELSTDVLTELVPFAIASYRVRALPEGEQFILKIADIEFKCIKENMYHLKVDAKDFADKLDIDINDEEFQSVANSAGRRIPDDKWWHHPLAEVKEINGEEVLNGYAVFEFLVNDLRGLDPDNDYIVSQAHSHEKMRHHITMFWLKANPMINVKPLLEKCIAGYEIDLMQGATLFKEGMSKLAQESRNTNF